MAGRDEVRLIVSFEITDYERWEEVARACARHVADHEPGTLAYDWYVHDDRTHGRLFEVYESTEAFRNHLTGPVFTEIGPRFGNAIAWKAVETFGTMPEELRQILRGLPITEWERPTVSAG